MHLAEVLPWLSADVANGSLLHGHVAKPAMTCLVGTDLARVAGAKMARQPRRLANRPTSTMAAPDQLDYSLEALSNLVYLIRRSLDNPAKATHYLDFAEKVLADIAANRPPTGTVMVGHHDANADWVGADTHERLTGHALDGLTHRADHLARE
jgi:hypothetical protein